MSGLQSESLPGRQHPGAPISVPLTGSPVRRPSLTPAVTIGHMFSDTFAEIAPSSAPTFVAVQVVGAAVGLGLVLLLFSGAAGSAERAVVAQETRATFEEKS